MCDASGRLCSITIEWMSMNSSIKWGLVVCLIHGQDDCGLPKWADDGDFTWKGRGQFRLAAMIKHATHVMAVFSYQQMNDNALM